jgi:hypothetical protein
MNIMVTVSKKSLIAGGIVVLVGAIFAIGLIATSFDEAGKAIPLTTENRQIKAYLGKARGWQQALDETREQLLSLLPAGAMTPPEPTTGLWEPAPAGGVPLSVYQENGIATAAVDRLVTVSTQVDRAVVPQALQGTHAVVRQAVQDHLQLADLILDYVGAPDEAKIPGIEIQAEACQQDTSGLRELLDEGK